MKILLGTSGDVEVFLSFEETSELKDFPLFSYLKENELFKGKLGEIYTDLKTDGKHKVLLGLGKEADLDHEALREAFYKLGKKLISLKAKSAKLDLPKFEGLCGKKSLASVAEGLLHSEYVFDKYKTEKEFKPSVKEFYINALDRDQDKAQEAIDEAVNILAGVFLTRDLVNEPAIVLTPKELAKRAKEELEPLGIKVTVYGQKEIEEMGMKAFLSVSLGSENEPQFIVMEYLGDKNSDEKLALVGKGLTYDTGGYSLKPSKSMDTMFTDMAGSASVIGSLKAVALGKLEKNVVGIVAACENSISGKAYKPGDIISSMSGKTIEVNNTDAEGRLTLADALWYAATEVKADKIIDLATLTGACVVALSDVATGAVTNDLDLCRDLVKASKRAGEHIWHLPHFKEFDDRVLSDKADLINTSKGPMGAGTITAGLFLGHFVKDIPWVHLDIAGTSYLDTPRTYLPKGASGIPVSTLYNYIKCN